MDRGGVQACAGVDYLEDERRDPGFSVEAMRVVVWGGEERARVVQQLSQLVAQESVFSKDDDVRVTRADGFKRSFAKAKHEHVLATRLNLSLEHRWLLHLVIDDVNYTALHWHMFIPAIEGQASDAQAAEWLPLARSCAWLGCYVQTEMGHGSNVQGLETTATFLPDSDEFDLHSPTLTSTKWWPGGLGKVSTHAIVYARLVLAGKDHGVHAFLVQLRSLDDHTPLRGVTVGDIGTKFGNGGYNTMDNGFVSFRHVRIPRTNMLMRYSEVTREGQYRRVSGASRQLAYGAMVYVRKGLVLEAGLFLARAVTIATRYSCVRRQFGASPPTTTQETKVMDYATQQLQLVVLLARAYAFIVSGQWMNELYDSTMASIRRGDASTLPEVHAATAGLKALTTAATADGIEECRKLCGGHGYLCASGLPQLFAVYVPACTYEGDNTVLMLQVARYLLKAIAAVAVGNSPSGTAAYLAHAHRLRAATMSQQAVQAVQVAADGSEGAAAAAASAALLEALQARAVFLVTIAAEAVAAANSIEEGFQSQSVALVKASRAHCQVLVATNFYAKAEEVRQSMSADAAALSRVLRSLADVYALATITEGSGAADLLEAGYLQPQQPRTLRQALTARVAALRPRSVPLVDAFGFTDHYLNSDLGRHDGDVYTHLHRRALNDPINARAVVDGYEEHLRPLLKGYAVAPASGASRL